MNKKYGKILLIIIIVFQLAVPTTFLTVKMVRKKAVNEYGKDIKVSVEAISFDENTIYIESEELGELDVDYGFKYTVFREGEDGYFSVSPTDEKPKDGVYLNTGSYSGWSWYCIPYRNSGINEEYLELENVGYLNIYNSYIEEENILNGSIEGPLTEAYMIIRIYKNEFEIKEVYVGGVTLKEFVDKTKTGEIDPNRFEYLYDDYYYYDEWDEEVTDYTEEDVTESVADEAA